MWWKDYGSPGCWDEMLRAGRPHDTCRGVMRDLDSLGPELLDRRDLVTGTFFGIAHSGSAVLAASS
jgi:hypothetical protein